MKYNYIHFTFPTPLTPEQEGILLKEFQEIKDLLKDKIRRMIKEIDHNWGFKMFHLTNKNQLELIKGALVSASIKIDTYIYHKKSDAYNYYFLYCHDKLALAKLYNTRINPLMFNDKLLIQGFKNCTFPAMGLTADSVIIGTGEMEAE